MASCVRLEVLLRRVVPALTAAGAQVRVLKGPAVARLDYPHPAMRGFGDIDVVVHADDYAGALRALEGIGLRRMLPPVHEVFDRQWSKGATFQDADGFEVDVHRTLATGRFGLTIDLDELLERSVPVRIGNLEVLALDAPARLVHSCIHTTLGGNLRYVSHRDVAQQVLGGACPAETVALARRWGCESVLAHGLQQAWKVLALVRDEPLLEWARTARPDPAEVRAMQRYLHSPAFRTQALTGLQVVPGVRAKMQYLGSLAFPDDANLQARHVTRVRALARALVSEVREVVR